MSVATKVELVHNPIKVCTVEGKYTNDNHKLTTRLCLENAVIANGTWDMGINCVKVYSENINKTNIMNSVNISTNLVRGFQHTNDGVQSFNPTIASFFFKLVVPVSIRDMLCMICPQSNGLQSQILILTLN